jgi:hypothetical protein
MTCTCVSLVTGRQRVVDDNAKALDNVSNLNSDRADIDLVNWQFSWLPYPGADNDRFGLFGFIASPFKSSQGCVEPMQLVRIDSVVLSFSGMYSSVSPAYCAWSTPKEPITRAIGDTSSKNSNGPSTDPCGTPCSSMMSDDCCWRTWTVSGHSCTKRSR